MATNPDLWSSEFFSKKAQERVNSLRSEEFEVWAEAKERYIETKIKPLQDQYKQSDHDWFKDFSRRRGEAMHHSDLIYRIQKLNPCIFVLQSVNFPEDWGLYTEALGRIQFLTGVHKGWLHEWSFALVDDRDLPTEERRGWRTVLVYCLLKGALMWADVIDEFGEPNDGFNEERWMNATTEFRHGGDAISGKNIANVAE